MSFCCNIALAHHPLKLLEEERVPGGVQPPGRGKLLFGVFEVENDGHIAIEDLQQVDDLGVLRAAAGRQADVEPLGGVPHLVRLIGLGVLGVVALNGQDALGHQLGGLVVADGKAALNDDDGVLLHGVAVLAQHPGENDDFHRARQIFHVDKGH